MQRSITPYLVAVAQSSPGKPGGAVRGDGRLLCTIPLFRPAIFNPKPKMIRAGERKRQYQTIDKGVLH